MTDRPVQTGDRIAVYGLLRAGETGFAKFGLARAFKALGPCTIPGRLYDLGSYPGLVEGDGAVAGELFEVLDAAVMPTLDAWEDYWPCDPERSRYERVRIDLLTPADARAWVYVWRKDLDTARLIESGDWLQR